MELAFADNMTRIRAVRVAYFEHGFGIDLIAQLSGFPAWRIRQALYDGTTRTS